MLGSGGLRLGGGTEHELIRELLHSLYRLERSIILPNLKHSQYIYEDILSEYVRENTKWLDLGCGHKILPDRRLKAERELVERSGSVLGIDGDLSALREHKTIPQDSGQRSRIAIQDREVRSSNGKYGLGAS